MAVFTSLASLTNASGQYPLGSGGLYLDPDGNLLGTASMGGSGGFGTVFELRKSGLGYETVPVSVVAFGGANGNGPSGTLVADPAGNLYGTTNQGGDSSPNSPGYGTVFKIARTDAGYAATPEVIARFDFAHGASPQASLVLDTAGNLYGTTVAGGSNLSQGSVFEIERNAAGFTGTPKTLALLNGSTGYNPRGELLLIGGTLYGTGTSGGPTTSGDEAHGAVFQVATTQSGAGAGATALASFTGPDGSSPVGGLVMDRDGNLFGTTLQGGASATGPGMFGYGTVFEIEKNAGGYDPTPITLASFNYANGAQPRGTLLIDTAGNLFGTTSSGGRFGDGTVFELAKLPTGYSGSPTTLVAFDNTNGEQPGGALIADAAGNLFGTTRIGGTGNFGTVFEITGSGFVVCFAAGTLIRTVHGDVAVEHLAAGDVAVTASGALRPIRWIGHRAMRPADHAEPWNVHPVRIRAGAFGRELPARDLLLSPGHPVLVGADADNEGGHLVPVMCLVNGTTVARVAVTGVTYWHVELDAHDILLAEGLPAESYLDGGDRAFFSEADYHAMANPDFVVPGLAGRCRPVALDGPVVEAERQRLDAVFAATLATHAAWGEADIFASTDPSGMDEPLMVDRACGRPSFKTSAMTA